MGSPGGVFKANEVQGVDEQIRAQIREDTIQELIASEQIRAIVRRDPKILKELTDNPEINRILREVLEPRYPQLKK